MTLSIEIKQNIQYYSQKCMDIYNKNDNNMNKFICFPAYLYYTYNFIILNWIKILQMVQDVVIKLLYNENINFAFI